MFKMEGSSDDVLTRRDVGPSKVLSLAGLILLLLGLVIFGLSLVWVVRRPNVS